MISITSLSKSYGNKMVLNDITISFSKGKVYGIVGKNGAGKTTLFNCISGLEIHSGEISCDFEILKDHLGYLQTEPHFFSKITGREYLQLFCNAVELKNVDLDIKNVFDLPLQQYAMTYSTGMRKKLALTAILIQNNEIYILDEPFNGVDIQSNIVITEIIQRLKTLNKTIIISSHIFSALKDTCDEIHLLKDGSFVRKAMKDEFDILDQEMKTSGISRRIDRLGLV